MLQYLTGTDALTRVDAQHAGQEVHCVGVDLAVRRMVEIEPHPSVVLVDLLETSALEKRLLCEQDVEDGSSREDVADWVHFLPLDKGGDFGCYVAWRSTPIEEIIFTVDKRCESKIDYNGLEARFSSEHDVFRLDIAMHNAIVMDFLESLRHSYHKLPDLRK